MWSRQSHSQGNGPSRRRPVRAPNTQCVPLSAQAARPRSGSRGCLCPPGAAPAGSTGRAAAARNPSPVRTQAAAAAAAAAAAERQGEANASRNDTRTCQFRRDTRPTPCNLPFVAAFLAQRETMSMPRNDPKRIGLSADVKPHAYDPATQPELFEGVLARRVVAFCIDVLVIAVPLAFLAIFIFMFGLVTLGLGWVLFFFYGPIAVIWALIYYGLTFGSASSATIGMRMVDLEMRTWYGAPCYFVLGAVHAIGYWLSVTFLTPFILLVALFNDRRRLLHDMLVGTIVINNTGRASALRSANL